MFHSLVALSIVLIYIHEASSGYLLAEKNFHKMKMERNNKVNTAVWKRGGEAEMERKVYHGDFLFPGASPDADGLSAAVGEFAENNINGNNDGESSAANYFSRLKRATKGDKRDATACRGDESNCIETTEGTIRSTKPKSEFISKLKPATVFNDYPYEIAVLLNDDLNDIVKKSENSGQNKNHDVELKVVPLTDGKDYVDIYVTPTDRVVDINEIYAKLRDAANRTINTIDSTMKPNNYDTDASKNMVLTEKANVSDEYGKTNRNIIMGIFNKDHEAWPQKAPKIDARNNDVVLSKAKSAIMSKTINGEGLIKLLSVLTRTFKKIMKQHEDIQKIHGVTNDVTKNIDEMSKKLQEFEEKYKTIVELSKKVAMTGSKVEAKYGHLERDQRELTRNMANFVQHQNKFVLQQKQFYDIQKTILAQNEDINKKQALIARSQNSVSHRQNEFARIIQKVRKLYNSRKNSKLSPNMKFKSQKNKSETTTTTNPISRSNAETTESVKINLFSIPVKEKLKNQDENILSEKDEQSIDDIVYKFYFNNTFIDNLLKTGILASFVNEPNPSQREVKKRSREEIEKLIEKTVMLPVASEAVSPVKRQRRWINRKNKVAHVKAPVANRFKYYDDNENPHKKKRGHKSGHSKHNIETATEKRLNNEDAQTKKDNTSKKTIEKLNMEKKMNAYEEADPYRLMATNFCNQIKQNTNGQILNWCIEKALRKLQAIDVKKSLLPLERKDVDHNAMKDNVEALAKTIHTFRQFKPSDRPLVRSQTESIPTIKVPVQEKVGEMTSPPQTQLAKDSLGSMFFPDNDQLESNLKQYELVPDTEGAVFYDGSVHSSKIVNTPDDEAASDIMPGMDSNSHMDIDPHALEIQAQRRAFVRSFNAKILKDSKNK